MHLLVIFLILTQFLMSFGDQTTELISSDCSQIHMPDDRSYEDRRAADGSLRHSDKFAKGILCQHNYFREHAGLPLLHWGKSLASLATSFAAKLTENGSCDFYHSANDKEWQADWLANHTEFKYNRNYGENLFELIKKKVNQPIPLKFGLKAVVNWFSEIKDYYYVSGQYRGCSTEDIGHFTQIMWKDTKKVGCDYVYCSTGKNMLVICEYGPTGNWRNLSPFNETVWETLKSWEYVTQRYGTLGYCSENGTQINP